MAESFKARFVLSYINIQASSDEWLELLPWDFAEDLPLYCLFQNVLHITLPFISGMNEFENWFRGKLSGQLENGRQGAHSVVLFSVRVVLSTIRYATSTGLTEDFAWHGWHAS